MSGPVARASASGKGKGRERGGRGERWEGRTNGGDEELGAVGVGAGILISFFTTFSEAREKKGVCLGGNEKEKRAIRPC